MGFVERLHRRYEKDWREMLAHPFLAETASGDIPDERFANWVRQDYVFVRESIRFIALMIPAAPVAHRKGLSDTISGFHQELELFERMAADHEISLEGVEPAPTNLAYINYLLTTAAFDPYEAAYTALYTGEKAYLDSWLTVKRTQESPSKWQAFIDQWTSDGFQQWVASLAREVDTLAEEASETLRARMERRFVDGMRYEYQFWDLAYHGESWGLAE
ncbi:MAG: TenA family protein [Chloroflexota bacterium]